jgi:hypothetical protein
MHGNYSAPSYALPQIVALLRERVPRAMTFSEPPGA